MTESLRLFLIEDDDDIALLIRRILERVGHQVTRCRTAADAVIVLAHNTFDLVVLDYLLPDEMSGLDLLQMLAREGISAPVLMITAEGNQDIAAKAFRAGALDYLVKDAGLSFLNELPKRVSASVNRYRLEQANALLIQALESARDGIMIADLQGVMLKVNQALVTMTGYSRQELEGQTPRLLKSGAHPPEFYAGMWRTVLSRNSWQGEVTNRRKDGTFVPTSMTISPIVDTQGRLTHFVGIQRDITEHKLLERQLLQAQKMQSVGTLAGGVAHEFNNLLAGINGYAALGLREADLPPTIREFLQNVVTLSERAAGLTRQLLAFARKPALSRQRTVIPELLRSTADLVRRTLHVEVALEAADLANDGGPLFVEADANQLQQALVNLTLNARDAIKERQAAAPGAVPEGSTALSSVITFRVGHEVLDVERFGFPQHVPPGDYVVLSVIDEGCGMRAEVLNQALDPFFTTKEVGQGTGLGLPMVFGIVQGHGGFLTIETRRDQGTCISLYLPRLRTVAAKSQPGARATEVVEPERGPRRLVLVIDDEEPVLDVVRRFLLIAGHQISVVTSGQDGVNQLASGMEADLVILDLMMPGEDTIANFDRLRQCRPGVPILLCTGLPEAGPALELLRRPNVGLIRKPFRMNELWYAVNQALSK